MRLTLSVCGGQNQLNMQMRVHQFKYNEEYLTKMLKVNDIMNLINNIISYNLKTFVHLYPVDFQMETHSICDTKNQCCLFL